ncbi:MAG: family 16 glycoside hydrolase [Verrucomicrobiia bacterium]
MTLSLLTLALLQTAAFAVEQIPADRARQIYNAAPEKARVAPNPSRRVLIWNTPGHLMEKDPHKGYCIPYGSAALEALGKKTAAFEPVVSDDLALFLPENIRQFDAIVLNNSSGPWITPTDDDMAKPAFQKHGRDKAAVEHVLRRSLLDWVAAGHGIVALHFAIAANAHWPEFRELLGATFTGHPWNEEVGVTVEDPQHPVVAAFEGKEFRLADEIYEYGPPYDRSKLRVLLSLDPARSNMGVKWIKRKDNDFALAWVKSWDNGRILHTSFGHRTEIFWDPRVLQFYLDAIQFATGDLPAPTEPRADRPVRTIPGTSPAPGLPGFVSLFNGRDLDGWQGDRRIWSVQDGVITGQTTPEVRVSENNFLLWKDEVEDFELRLKFKLEGGNSGIYYRARQRPPNQKQGEALAGTQADMSEDGRWTGVIMEYTLREVLAERGQRVAISTNGQKQVVAVLGDPAELLAKVRANDWNDYTVLARGGHVAIKINSVPMAELDDQDPKRLVRGWLGLQVHTGPPMRVQFKDIYLRRLPDR